MRIRRGLVLGSLMLPTLHAQEPDPVLQRLPANATNLIVLHDPLPHVDAILQSEALVQLLDRTAAQFGDVLAGRQVHQLLDQQLKMFRDLVPRQVVVGVPSSTVNSFLQLGRAALDALLLEEVLATGQAPDAVVDSLRTAVRTALASPLVFDGVLWLELRDTRTAESWFGKVVEAARRFPAEDGLHVRVDDDTLTIAAKPLQLQGGALGRLLRGAGFDASSLADWTLRASLEQQDTRLLLRLGEPAAGPLSEAAIQTLWAPGPSQLLFVHTDCDAGVSVVEALFDDLDPVLEAELSEETLTLLARLIALLQKAANGMAKGSRSLAVDDGVVMVEESDFGAELDLDLTAPPELVRCIVPAEGPFLLMGLPLDAFLSSALSSLTGRLMAQFHQAGYRAAFEWLYDSFEPAIDYVHGEDSAVFDPGCLLVLRGAQLRGWKGWRPSDAMPFLAAALLAEAESAKAGRRFVDRITALLAKGAGLDARKLWRDADLGIGLPARELQLAAIAPAYPGFGLDADFRPHVVMVGSTLLLSTDVALTKDLIGRLRASGGEAPAVKAVTWAQFRGAHLTVACAAAAQWIAAVKTMPPAQVESLPDLTKVEEAVQLLGILVAEIEVIESMEQIDGRHYRSVWRWQLQGK